VQLSRITINPRQMGGVPCIRGLRIPVATVLDMVAEGMEAPEILKAYPDLETEDIREALRLQRKPFASANYRCTSPKLENLTA